MSNLAKFVLVLILGQKSGEHLQDHWYSGITVKFQNFWTPIFFFCNLPKIQTKSPNHRVFSQENASGIANSEDPDQAALGAV